MFNRITTTTTTPATPRRFRACHLMVSLTPRQVAWLRELDPDLTLPEALAMFLDSMLDDLPDIDDPVPFALPGNN